MKPERWRKVEEIFQSAIERDPMERAAFLNEACAGDDSLLREVQSLIAADEQAGSFIDVSSLAREDEESLSGKRIGPYRVISEIGHGGMGSVYLAAREDEYRKQVAIKLIRRGMDTDFIIRRFLGERQILASLDHPNIARLLDGGTTEDGLPYFVMEYIEGTPIDRYSDENRLNTAARLRLFRDVCAAVQYAHRNLVIHRDIKPGNILVTRDGEVKLLDFGIAKLLDPAAQSLDQTATAIRMMTPDYASPEQVRGEQITTTSDVYSLGVVLYELLTGHRPYRLKSRQPHEIMRVICEEEPERPSIALTQLEAAMTAEVSSHITPPPRRMSKPRERNLHRLRRQLEGDLDNILMKALSKETERRYSSVEQFSEDIRRHLEGLPLIARNDTLFYRAGKFIRRHRVVVAAAIIVAMTLIAGIIATAWQAHAARQQRDKAQYEKAKAEQVSAFLQSMLQYANPSWYSPGKDKGPKTTVLDALNDAAGRIDTQLADQPEVRSDLHGTIGDTYRALGLLDDAQRHFEASLEIRRGLFGQGSAKVAESLFYLGAVQHSRGNLEQAEMLIRQALEIQRRRPDEGNNLPFIIQELTSILCKKGDPAAAEPLDQEALELFRHRYGQRDITIAFGHSALGRDYYSLGDLDRAQEHFQESLDILLERSGSETYFQTLGLGLICTASGKYEEAERLLSKAVDDVLRSQGERSDVASHILASLAHLHSLKGEREQARREADREVARFHRLSPDSYFTLIPIAKVFVNTGQHARAESLLREALDAGNRYMVKDSWVLAEVKGALGECLMAQKRYAEAEPLLIESYESFKQSQVEQSFRIKEARDRLAAMYERWNKP